MNLVSTTQSLEIVLGEVTATTECDFVTAYADVAVTSFALGEHDGVTNGTTAVTVVAAPAAALARQVKEVRLHNNDTVDHTVTLRLNNGGTHRIVQQQVIPPNGDFAYSPSGSVTNNAAAAVLLESGTIGAKISALPAFNLTLPPDGTEKLAVVEAAATTGMTLAQLYTLFADWFDLISANPLDAPSGSNNDGIAAVWISGRGDGLGSGGVTGAQAGDGGDTGNGGQAFLGGGSGGVTSGNGGAVFVQAGSAPSDGAGGTVSITAGSGAAAGGGGALVGAAGAAGDTGNGGYVEFDAGNGGASSGNGGGVTLAAGNATDGNGGSIELDIGQGGGSGVNGNLTIFNLPTSDPGVSNAVWLDNNCLVASGANTRQQASVASGSAVALTTATAKDVTTLTLAAGKWAIFGAVYFTGNAATTVTRAAGSLSTTADTMATDPGSFANQYLAGAVFSTIGEDIAITGMAITDLAGGATYHLVAQASFAVNTLSAYGLIFAIPIL